MRNIFSAVFIVVYLQSSSNPRPLKQNDEVATSRNIGFEHRTHLNKALKARIKRSKRDSEKEMENIPKNIEKVTENGDIVTHSGLDRVLFEYECGQATVLELVICLTILGVIALLIFCFTFIISAASTSEITDDMFDRRRNHSPGSNDRNARSPMPGM